MVPLKETFAKYGVAKFKNIQDFFTHRVRANLHVVVSMDFSASEFAMRCESNPALYTRCAIMWNAGWSAKGLTHVRQIPMPPPLSVRPCVCVALPRGAVFAGRRYGFR